MGHSTNENEGPASKDQDGLQLNDDSQGEDVSGVILKKGPWTSAEDTILIDYVKKHGEGNWNAVQKHSGLSRCGKSCRLRWANHLRPNLKKGAFTAEEERLIAELHAKMGNKWARMAAHLPGRTDNEIKNYWNTRIKRRQRAGLPLYPPELCLQAFQEQHGQLNDGIDGADRGLTDLPNKSYEIPDVMFDGLKTNQGIFHYLPDRSDISTNHILLRGYGPSQYCSNLPSTMTLQKRLCESIGPFIGNSVKNEFFPFDQFQNDTCHKFVQSHGISSLDPVPTSDNSMSFSHSHSNGNSSASQPTLEAVKFELPSLQYPETDLTSWGASSNPLPLFDSVDAFIQSPRPASAQESDNSSPRNSGLLDALLYQAKTLSSAKNHSSDKVSKSSSTTPYDNAESSELNMCETEWEDYADPISPFGHSATSFFDECAPISANRSSMDEENLNGNIKSEPIDHPGTSNCESHTPSSLHTMRPDALLASDWLERNSGYAKNHGVVTDTFTDLHGDDLATDYEHMTTGTDFHGDDLATDYEHMTTGTTASSHGWGIDSCTWNNMPAVCQMSDFP